MRVPVPISCPFLSPDPTTIPTVDKRIAASTPSEAASNNWRFIVISFSIVPIVVTPQIELFRLIRGFYHPPPAASGDAVAVFVLLDVDRMDIGSRRRLALVIERRLCFQQVAG